MDKARANFDKANATRDAYFNATAKNQNGIDVDAVPRKPSSWQAGEAKTFGGEKTKAERSDDRQQRQDIEDIIIRQERDKNN